MSSELKVRERGSLDLDIGTFEKLVDQADFWTLVENGIVSVTRLGAHAARLHGARYVGRALVGETEITVTEKVPGSLSSLISHACGDAFRVPEAEAAATPPDELIQLLIRAFLEKVRDYVSQGINFEYGARAETGSLIGGTLDVARTVQLRTLGMRHMAAFSRPILRQDVPVNKVILATLRQVEGLAVYATIPAADIASARMLVQFFADIRDIEVLLGHRRRWVSEARALEADAVTDFERDLLALAAVILSHESFEPDLTTLDRVPRSWFVNLEMLFEEAVRKTLATIAPENLQVTNAGFYRPPIFGTTDGYFRADPDLVVKEGNTTVAVGDVKYKTWNGLSTPSLHHDVYQLLVHTAAYGGSLAFLVYAHDALDCRHLGMSATGADTWAFGLDVRDLETHLAEILGVCGIAGATPALAS